MLFSTMIITQLNLYKNVCFFKYAHNSGPKGSADLILRAFDVKFQDKNEGMPPGPVDFQKKVFID